MHEEMPSTGAPRSTEIRAKGALMPHRVRVNAVLGAAARIEHAPVALEIVNQRVYRAREGESQPLSHRNYFQLRRRVEVGVLS